MSDFPTLPRLAALYLTHGHRVPDELIAALENPVEGWECPLNEGQTMGREQTPGVLKMVPPEY